MLPLDLVFLLLLSFLQVKSIIASDFSAMGSEFKQCVRGAQKPKLSECLGRSALNFIQRLDDSENVRLVEDFVTVKSESAAMRSLANVLDTDPVDVRGILEIAGAVMGQRSLEWHMDGLYPGLMFKIGPTADANSVAEFVLDDAGQGERQFGFEDPTTGRLLAKQYLMPFLLGLKFNLVALVPLLFAGICLLLKKSLFLVKLAVYVSSFLGLGGVLGSLGGLAGGGGFGGGNFGGFGGSNFGFGGGFHGHRPVGHFPGKATVFGHGDELHHQYDVHEPSPYRRSERKVRFEQPRAAEAVVQASAPSQSPIKLPNQDRFYDFEHQRRPSNKMLEQEQEGEVIMRNFQDPNGMKGWQAVDCLSTESEHLVDTVTRDNKTWQITDYLTIEPLDDGARAQETRRMDAGLAGKLLDLVRGRALRIQLPRQLTISDAIDDFGNELGLDQGRKKKDKDKNMAMMGGMIMVATLAQMFLGKVILIAGSAFIMAKIALVISLLGSVKKGSTGHSGSHGGGGGGGSGPTEHVVVHSSHESGWHRSMPTHDYGSLQAVEQVEEPPMEYYQAYQMANGVERRLHQVEVAPEQPRPEATKPTRGFL
ncbi:hypothetical protein KR009_010241 [Drosophila setifemur]|nr:hypothetical protein KR009_010241 [Drosophila setifemur]